MRNPFKREEKLPEFAPSTDPEVEPLRRSSASVMLQSREAEVARTLRAVASWSITDITEFKAQIRMLADHRDPEVIRPREGQARQSYIRRSPAGKDNQDE